MATEHNTSSSNPKSTLTMSSHEIAVLTGKQHKNIMVDIRNMLKSLELNSAEFSAEYKDSTGRTLPCFNLPKRETLILVSGYNIQMRAKIIDRWQELEQGRKKSFIEDVVDGMKQNEVKLLGFNQMSLNSRQEMKTLQWNLQQSLGLTSKKMMKRRIDMRAPLNLLINGMSSGEFRRRIGLQDQHRDSNRRPMKTCDFLPLANQYALFRTDLLLSEFLRTSDSEISYEEACEWYLRYGQLAKYEAEKKYRVNLHDMVGQSIRAILGFVAEQIRQDVSPYTETQRSISAQMRSVIQRRPIAA